MLRLCLLAVRPLVKVGEVAAGGAALPGLPCRARTATRATARAAAARDASGREAHALAELRRRCRASAGAGSTAAGAAAPSGRPGGARPRGGGRRLGRAPRLCLMRLRVRVSVSVRARGSGQGQGQEKRVGPRVQGWGCLDLGDDAVDVLLGLRRAEVLGLPLRLWAGVPLLLGGLLPRLHLLATLRLVGVTLRLVAREVLLVLGRLTLLAQADLVLR